MLIRQVLTPLCSMAGCLLGDLAAPEGPQVEGGLGCGPPLAGQASLGPRHCSNLLGHLYCRCGLGLLCCLRRNHRVVPHLDGLQGYLRCHHGMLFEVLSTMLGQKPDAGRHPVSLGTC